MDTNEIEILEFMIAGNSYGINVERVNEIIPYEPVTMVPNAHPSIEGIFMPRETMITAINLVKALGLRENEDTSNDMLIITNVKNLNIAFHVHSVVGIHRVLKDEIIKPDETVNSNISGISTGVVKLDEKLVIILDFEKIVSAINT